MPYEITKKFERVIADYAGASHGIAVSSCTNAIFLSLQYIFNVERPKNREIILPSQTYVGVAMSVLHAGGSISFKNGRWGGCYELSPFGIWDSALRFQRGMFRGRFYCLSFHSRKHIAIGRGGMILTDDASAAEWLRRARFDGRRECDLMDDHFDQLGWNMNMLPEQSARGMVLFSHLKDKELLDIDDYDRYPDLSQFELFKPKNNR